VLCVDDVEGKESEGSLQYLDALSPSRPRRMLGAQLGLSRKSLPQFSDVPASLSPFGLAPFLSPFGLALTDYAQTLKKSTKANIHIINDGRDKTDITS